MNTLKVLLANLFTTTRFLSSQQQSERMDKPPAQEADIADVDMQDVDHSTQAEQSISDYSVEERQRLLKRIFTKRVEPLSLLSQPNESLANPQFSKEIESAYLKYTTFTVEVWANYDATTKRFFIDKRAGDCGKLMLKPRARAAHVKTLAKNDEFQLHRVRLEVGTPFTTLCHVDLRIKPSKLDVGPDVHVVLSDRSNGEHPAMIDFTTAVCDDIDKNISLAYVQDGMILRDIEDVATMFRRKPTPNEVSEKNRYPNEGPWMHLPDKKEEDTAWVDFLARGEACSADKCEGCRPRRPFTWFTSGTSRPRVIQRADPLGFR